MNLNKDKSVCEYNEFRRPRYFHGMLLDDKDFLDEQGYHAGKRRLLNRMLHGTGVVCGLDLNAEQGARWFEVTAGLALDCCGNEIYVNRTQRFDLSQLLPPKKTAADKDECKEPEAGPEGASYYVGIRYDERGTNPVSVHLPGAGCDERTCENSRVKEGYCVEIVSCCARPHPAGYPARLLKGLCECQANPEVTVDKAAKCDTCDELTGIQKCMCVRLEEFCEQSVPCPECGHCDSPCHIVLGRIDVDKKGLITAVCINDCREYVLTGGLFQHLVISALSGAEEIFKLTREEQEIEIPKVEELARNPVKALCWVLRNFLIEKTEVETVNCTGLFGQARQRGGDEKVAGEGTKIDADPAVAQKMMARETEIQELRDRTTTLEAKIKELQNRQPPSPPPA